MMIFFVDLEVVCEIGDSLGKDGNLDLGGSCIAFVRFIAIDNFCFLPFSHGHLSVASTSQFGNPDPNYAQISSSRRGIVSNLPSNVNV